MNLAQKIDAIVGVLDFYASRENYSGPQYINRKDSGEIPLDHFSDVMVDRGQKARDLLSALHRELDPHPSISQISSTVT